MRRSGRRRRVQNNLRRNEDQIIIKSKENIVFLGMMGSGKTSIGFLISKKLSFLISANKSSKKLFPFSLLILTKVRNFPEDDQQKLS